MMRRLYLYLSFFLFCTLAVQAEDGSRLWLPDTKVVKNTKITMEVKGATAGIIKHELMNYWTGVPVVLKLNKKMGRESFSIKSSHKSVQLKSGSVVGLLYGVYDLLRLQDTGAGLSDLNVEESPAYSIRILNHWDNPDGTVERGYAGHSIWKWNELPDKLSPRYTEYARANASIGINGAVLNNVNADPSVLSNESLRKVKALADVFRPYGIRVYLSINFASPIKLGRLKTADPLDRNVIAWWRNKVKDIYRLIPDFGGFLVKANSEGLPGPNDYGRTHAQGANMLADALKPYGGIVMWRAFVYSQNDKDRAKQAYLEFKPFDGQFHDNVILQIKNGPIDFQPREPYSPLFGAMHRTNEMLEVEITQEYLGAANHLVFLAPMWKECLDVVSKDLKAVAGVANIGDDTNWCGHPFAQANWYAFGRLAWNPDLSSKQIAEEWLKQTFVKDSAFVVPVSKMMLESREAVVDYMTPLGLHHIMAFGHHYGPEPWCNVPGARIDWLPKNYHRADSVGLGFDRSSTGSGAVHQYPEPFCSQLDNINTCPEKYLLWFHHVPWNYRMHSGLTLWDELCKHYQKGLDEARSFQKCWDNVERYVDKQRFEQVQRKLKIQTHDAQWWKDACLLYFQQFSKKPFPKDMERPVYNLDDLMKVHLPITNYENPTRQMLP